MAVCSLLSNGSGKKLLIHTHIHEYTWGGWAEKTNVAKYEQLMNLSK